MKIVIYEGKIRIVVHLFKDDNFTTCFVHAIIDRTLAQEAKSIQYIGTYLIYVMDIFFKKIFEIILIIMYTQFRSSEL